MLTTDSHPVHVHRYRHDDPTVSFLATASTPGAETRFDTFPLGASILEPDLHLDLTQLQLVGDLRPLAEGQVFLRVELLLEFKELLGGERCPSTSIHSAIVEIILAVQRRHPLVVD